MNRAHEAVVHRLGEIGVRLSVDDFGTGRSSLSYLKRYHVGTLKIDQSLIQEINSGEDHAAVVAGTISLAHALGLNVVAEGVETREQLASLKDLDCDFVQGCYLGQPASAETLERKILVKNS